MIYDSYFDTKFLLFLDVISVISTIVAIVVGIVIAKKKGRSAAWGWVAFLLGWIGVIIIACQSNLNETTPTYTNTNASTSGYSLNPYVNSTKQSAERWDCAYCNASNHENATRCINCGQEKLIGWKCSSCKSINKTTDTFCSSCGNAKPSAWICDNCNKKNDAGSIFCSNCGNKKPE